jgi:RHS repeat-associated protein
MNTKRITLVFAALACLWGHRLDAQSTLIRDIESTYQFDGNGNLSRVVQTSGDGYVDSVLSNYQYNPPLWLMAMPSFLQMTSATPAGLTQTRTFEFIPDTNLGVTQYEVQEPKGDESTFVSTHYNFDAHGVSNGVDSTDLSGGQRRAVSYLLDPLEDIFHVSRTNALGQTESLLFHPAFGEIVAYVDVNAVLDQWQYDGLGRPKTMSSADGSKVSLGYGGPGLDLTVASATGQSGDVLYDFYGFEVQKDTTGFAGQTVVQLTTYNGQNLPSEIDGPCFYGTPACASAGSKSFAYDELGRVIAVTNGDGVGPKWTHLGLKTTHIDALGNQRYMVKDQLGQLIKSTAITTGGREISATLVYEPFRKLHTVTDALGNTATFVHDVRGRPTSASDGDSGQDTFEFTCFDELAGQQDGNSFTTTYVRDGLGRIKTITNKDGTITLVWDTAPYGVGRIASATSTDNVATTYVYNSVGQRAQSTTTVGSAAYPFSFGYDTEGRVKNITYPAGASGPAFTLQLNYNPYGFLYQTLDANTQNLFWQADNENERSQITAEHFGNGVSTKKAYDIRGRVSSINTTNQGQSLQSIGYGYYANGSLKNRSNQFTIANHKFSLSEFFKFDPLDRLESLHSIGFFVPPPPSVPNIFDETFTYDDIGNLKSRAINAGAGTSVTYQYGQNGAGPHAVTQANADSYQYNTGGNQTRWVATSGVSRSYTYNAVNLPTSITVTGGTPSPAQYGFTYNANQRRAAKLLPNGDHINYVGGLFEERVQGGRTTDVFFVPSADGRLIAQVEQSVDNSSQVHYIHHDALASIQAVSSATGTAEEQLWYEPFGQTVGAGSPGVRAAPVLANVTQGFSSDTQDADLNLVDMNGRVYDPSVTRFLTADPIRNAPLRTESLNRFSYAWNNPLKWVDPSGFQNQDPAPDDPFGLSQLSCPLCQGQTYNDPSAGGYLQTIPTSSDNGVAQISATVDSSPGWLSVIAVPSPSVVESGLFSPEYTQEYFLSRSLQGQGPCPVCHEYVAPGNRMVRTTRGEKIMGAVASGMVLSTFAGPAAFELWESEAFMSAGIWAYARAPWLFGGLIAVGNALTGVNTSGLGPSPTAQAPIRLGLGLESQNYRAWAAEHGFQIWYEVGKGSTNLEKLNDALSRATEINFNTEGLRAELTQFGTEIDANSEPIVGWTNYELTMIKQVYSDKVVWWYDTVHDALLKPW